MLHFIVKAGGYFNIGDDNRVLILDGGGNCRIMVNAPQEYNIEGRKLQ